MGACMVMPRLVLVWHWLPEASFGGLGGRRPLKEKEKKEKKKEKKEKEKRKKREKKKEGNYE